jgi:hypothetical protein
MSVFRSVSWCVAVGGQGDGDGDGNDRVAKQVTQNEMEMNVGDML